METFCAISLAHLRIKRKGGNNQTETAKSERSKLAQMYKRKNSAKSASTFRCAVPHEDGTTATGLVFGTHLKANIRQLVFSAYSWVDPQQNISALEGREKEQLVCVLKRKWVRFPRMK
uniref:Uncharacterized protein n=1 Tax=Palpitomonas bilix TaxID=652834 RepID=A0A7S3GLD3_9EUKA|mmetsp:Transcript_8258/g.21926  ORF Transcript_8258/g.21926 Transcript_8258/m.21926 type:complete len:118 (+) Transcript_8258:1222-1575(+)